MFSLKVIDKNERDRSMGKRGREVNLMVARTYEEGDRILLEISKEGEYAWVQFDDALGKIWFILPESHIIKFLLERRESISLQRHFPEIST